MTKLPSPPLTAPDDVPVALIRHLQRQRRRAPQR